jgi:hypothetical protein
MKRPLKWFGVFEPRQTKQATRRSPVVSRLFARRQIVRQNCSMRSRPVLIVSRSVA